MTLPEEPDADGATARPSIAGHVAIMRIDHWFKNLFVLPGIFVALTIPAEIDAQRLALRILIGLLAIGLVCSSNYVLNEVLDAPFDRHHPDKRRRPVPSGRVSIPLAYVQWLVLLAASIAVGLLVSIPFALIVGSLWIMGCIYNVWPIRSKDIAYLDVLTEAINNPIRMLAGWLIVGPDGVAPASLLLAYWMAGAYFMGIKRLAEYRHIGDADVAAAYRRSFASYSENHLLTAIMFYASAAMLFFGVFVMRYRLELVMSFPLIALVMALYLNLGLRPDSPTQNPETLYRQPGLMWTCAA